jgi:hypothetical protein
VEDAATLGPASAWLDEHRSALAARGLAARTASFLRRTGGGAGAARLGARRRPLARGRARGAARRRRSRRAAGRRARRRAL